MSKVQLLIAAMGQKDFSLIQEMNIETNAVIANQDGRNDYSELKHGDYTVKMVTTNTIGVGVNRNTALLFSDADILLFADDDIIYNNDYEKEIIEAYNRLPDADMIIFGMELTKKGETFKKVIYPIKKRHIWNSLKFGTYVFSIKREAYLKHRLSFSQLFGGGCIYGSGEDSLFIKDCFAAGMKVYTYPYALGKCSKDSSTWFKGFNSKYFYDKGALFYAMSKTLAKPLCLQELIRNKKYKESGLTFFEAYGLMKKGIKGFKTLTEFSEGTD